MPRGICKLCLYDKELQDSHLIPKGVFKSLRIDGKESISVTAERILKISPQFKAFLLCRDCEERLNIGGETWVLKHMARQIPKHQFLLFDMLTDAAVCRSDEDGRTYAAAQVPEIDTGRLAYFALSMLWRIAIHDWKGVDGYIRRLDLGPYEDPIRRFLVGEGPFPARCFTRVLVWPNKTSVLYATYLIRRNLERQFRLFSFYIPGITFCLYVGKGVPAELRESCCYSSARKPILASNEAARNAVLLLERLDAWEHPGKSHGTVHIPSFPEL